MFEYKLFKLNASALDTIPEYLNDLGADGWEMVSAVECSGQVLMFFKRMKELPPNGMRLCHCSGFTAVTLERYNNGD
jgi:hypothetical protein